MNFLRRLFRRTYPHRTDHCANCGRPRHKHDQFEILAWRHKSCSDPRNVGQMSIGEKGEGAR